MGALQQLRALWRATPLRIPREARASERETGAAALSGAPALFPGGREARALYRLVLPGAAARARARALEILAGRVEVLGVITDGRDWHGDPLTGGRFDPSAPAAEILLDQPGPDPRGPWTLGRASHLLELGVAARLHPDLAEPARAAVGDAICHFLDENPLGRGIQWADPREAALRALHWLAAVELTGGAAALAWRMRRRLGGALMEHGRFVADNGDRRSAAPGSHHLGELVGLLAIGAALSGAADGAAWRHRAARQLGIEAERAVLADGACRYGSTAAHRFALEALIAGDRLGCALGQTIGLASPLARMMRFLRGYLTPAGCEPAFGDCDDARVLPLVPRPLRSHGYLLAVGAARLGDAGLKPPGAGFSEEAVWFGGASGYRRWRGLPASAAAGVVSFPEGGLHVLRTPGRHGDYAALRCGGHAAQHRDQLSVVIALGGIELVVDPGTVCGAADPVWRDRFRGTAAHSTLVVDGLEQAPAGAVRTAIEERSDVTRLTGERGCQRRELLYDPARRAFALIDRVSGSGHAVVESRLQLGDVEADAKPLAPSLRRWLDSVEGPWRRPIDGRAALLLSSGGERLAVLAPLGATGRATLGQSWWAPRYGLRRPTTVARFGGARALPSELGVVLMWIPPQLRG